MSARAEPDAGYLLHTYPYRETSLLLDTLTRLHGRVPMIAKGAKRPRSQLRGQLVPFQPMLLAWTGKGEVKTLMRAEWQRVEAPLAGQALMCGFYLNELLIRLLAREDPHEQLFDHYQEALAQLRSSDDPAPVLRRFETTLLQELGYALVLDREVETDAAIDPSGLYTYALDRGPLLAAEADREELAVAGKTLLDMAAGRYDDPATLQQSKALMRALITHYLGGRPLHSRQLLKELQRL
ncbi:MAG TPA: DNA repair protein RecO [Pelomicrobium sp.]|nr:DNA repair protein RecO [Pelomicrobium sp.]